MKNQIRSDVVINLIRTVTMMILSFVTFPFVCRVLGDEMIGLYSWATAFVYYFLILARISIPNIAVRECIKVRDDPVKLAHKTQEFFILQAITTLLSFGLMCMVVFLVGVPDFSDPLHRALIFVLSLNFLTGVLSFEWVFTALEKHTYMAIRSIVIATIVDILIFAFVIYPEGILLYAFLSILTTVLTVASNLIYLPQLVKFRKTEKYNFKQYFPLLGILFLISVVAAIYDKTDTFILGFIDSSKASVGSYSVAMKGVEIIIGIITALSTVFMPRAMYYHQKNDEKQFRNLNKYSMNICMLIVIPAIALMIGLATPITKLIAGPEGYDNANMVLIALVSLMLTFSLSSIIYTQILIPLKKEKYYLIAVLLAASLNVGLSLLFGLVIFKDNPAFGVALGTAITDTLLVIVLSSMSWKESKHIILNINNLKIIILGLIIGVISTIVSPILLKSLENNMSQEIAYLVDILIIFAGSLLIYISGLILSKEKLTRSIIHR